MSSIWIARAVAMFIFGGIAATSDIRTRRIPNAVSASMLAAAFLIAAFGSWPSIASAAIGAAVIGGPFLFFWLFGLCGAGDAKLGFGLGALLGPLSVRALLFGSVLGLAVSLALVAARFLPRLSSLARALGHDLWGRELLAAVSGDGVWHVNLPLGLFLAVGSAASLGAWLIAPRFSVIPLLIRFVG